MVANPAAVAKRPASRQPPAPRVVPPDSAQLLDAMLRDFVTTMESLYPELPWCLIKLSALSQQWVGRRASWDDDVDVLVLVQSASDWWEQQFGFLQEALQHRGWEVKRQFSFLASMCPRGAPLHKRPASFKDAMAEAAIRGHCQRDDRIKAAAALHNAKKGNVKRGRGDLRLDIHVVEPRASGKLTLGRKTFQKKHVLPTQTGMFGDIEVKLPAQPMALSKAFYTGTLRPKYEL